MKGIGSSFLVMAIVLVAVLLVSVLAVGTLRSLFETEDAACATQVRAHSIIVTTTGNAAGPSIDCPTKHVERTVSGATEANKIIADEMKRCWDIWGRGGEELFREKDGLFCHVCSTVDLQGVATVEGLSQYLDAAKLKSGQTYAEYLAGSSIGDALKNASYAAQAPTLTMSTDPRIGVIFYYAKGLDSIQKLRDTFTPSVATGVIGGTIAGAAVAVGILALTGTGVGIVPAVIVAGGAALGGTGGLYWSTQGRPDASTMVVVLARPLSDADIQQLGCMYYTSGAE